MPTENNAAATAQDPSENAEPAVPTAQLADAEPATNNKLLTTQEIFQAIESAPEDEAVDRLIDTASVIANSPAVQTAARLQGSIVPASAMRMFKFVDELERREREFRSISRMVQLPAMLDNLPTVRIVDDLARTQAAVDRMGLDLIGRHFISSPMQWQINASAWRIESVQRDLLRNIEAMNSAWDRGLFTVPALPAVALPTVDFSAFETAARLTSELNRLVSYWRELSTMATWLGRRARSGYLSAMAARYAAVHGKMEPVAEFIATWLGHKKPTKELVEAVAAALLDADWETSPDDTLQVIRSRAAHHRRAQRPAWETQLRGRRLALLSEPLPGSDAEGAETTVADLLTDRSTPEQLYLRDAFSPRVEALLKKLKPEEREVALAYAHGGGFWKDAAAQAGAEDPAKVGERVRKKLKRIGDEDTRRRAAS
jgi:hypothetical protein